MRRRILFWFFVGVGLFATAVAGGAKKVRSVSITPVTGRPVAVVIDEEVTSYFLCSAKEPLEISVSGPGTLEIATRLLFPKGKTEGKYTVELREGGKVLKRHETQTQVAAAKLSGRSEVPGKSRKFRYDLPEGQHRLTLAFVTGEYPEVAARFTFSVRKNKGEFVAITPLSFARTATALIKEKQFTYYVATPTKPVQFRVVGPVRVQIVSRLTYDERLKGTQKYTVTATEGKKLFNQFALETTKSTSVVYNDWPEVAPGKSRTFYIDVPAGEHLYDFALTGSVARAVALRFSLPHTALSNEP